MNTDEPMQNGNCVRISSLRRMELETAENFLDGKEVVVIKVVLLVVLTVFAIGF